MKPAIYVEQLSKRYRIGEGKGTPYRTFRETIMAGLASPWQWLNGRRRTSSAPHADGSGTAADRGRGSGEIWALRDVSFEVPPGEVLGVIGCNGAGKSTLLKILSRVTKPTAGLVNLRGRVGSLLEVGTGFHPELTGRENILLNGAILGMGRREVARKFDDIVAFAELHRFLDTPVKRYSSGMYTRLAFAVASHLEPEILLVDEVLAVGDAAFQKKCLGKMGQVSRQGRTVLFVSHNMTAIKSLCTRALLVDQGRIACDGSVDEVVNLYLKASTDMSRTGVIPEDAPRHRDAPDEARFRAVRLTDVSGQEVSQLYFGQPFQVGFVCDVLKDIPDGHFEISISTVDGIHVTYSTTRDAGKGPLFLGRGRHEVVAEFDVVLLPREYTIDLGVHHHNGMTADFVQRALDFSILRVAESGADHYPLGRTRGHVRVPASWQLRPLTRMSVKDSRPSRDGCNRPLPPTIALRVEEYQ
jgi:lipopolysaccharide transport system ATP-binding protein